MQGYNNLNLKATARPNFEIIVSPTKPLKSSSFGLFVRCLVLHFKRQRIKRQPTSLAFKETCTLVINVQADFFTCNMLFPVTYFTYYFLHNFGQVTVLSVGQRKTKKPSQMSLSFWQQMVGRGGFVGGGLKVVLLFLTKRG